MSDDEPTEQVNVQVPKRTKELAKEKLEHGGLTRVIRESLSRVAHGEETTERERVKDHLKELRDEKREKLSERNRIDDQIAELEVKIERAESRLEELEDKVGEYEGMLQVIEHLMHDEGMHVYPGHSRIQDAAQTGNCTAEDVVADLKERNPDLDDEMFEQRGSRSAI